MTVSTRNGAEGRRLGLCDPGGCSARWEGLEPGDPGTFLSTSMPCSANATLAVVTGVEPQLKSLSQRELRNESGRVLRAVSEGQSFVVTNRGVPVARIVPLEEPAPALRIVRPARRQGGWAALGIARKVGAPSLAETLDELREDRQ